MLDTSHIQFNPAPTSPGAAASDRTAEATGGDGSPSLSSPKNSAFLAQPTKGGQHEYDLAQFELSHVNLRRRPIQFDQKQPHGMSRGEKNLDMTGGESAAPHFNSEPGTSTVPAKDGGGSVPKVEPSPVISTTAIESARSGDQTEGAYRRAHV